jgi:hypothetical protein
MVSDGQASVLLSGTLISELRSLELGEYANTVTKPQTEDRQPIREDEVLVLNSPNGTNFAYWNLSNWNIANGTVIHADTADRVLQSIQQDQPNLMRVQI